MTATLTRKSRRTKHNPSVRFDPEGGIGAIPDNQDVDYKGFTVFMSPGQYLNLNPWTTGRDTDHEHKYIRELADEIERGTAIGNPVLYMEYDPVSNSFLVLDHEGRHRMKALDMLGFKSIPVHVFPRGMRARHFKPEQLLESAFVADERSAHRDYIFHPKKIVLRGEEYER